MRWIPELVKAFLNTLLRRCTSTVHFKPTPRRSYMVSPVPSQNLKPDVLMVQTAKDANCRDVAHL